MHLNPCLWKPKQGNVESGTAMEKIKTLVFPVILGLWGLLVSVCMTGMTCYVFARLKAKRNDGSVLHHSCKANAIASPVQTTTELAGLDELTIASYPTLLRSSSSNTDDANDKICSICLSDYQPHEPLKSIPDCNHDCHTVCIDEWLRNKAVCPLCRNSHLRSIPVVRSPWEN